VRRNRQAVEDEALEQKKKWMERIEGGILGSMIIPEHYIIVTAAVT
jgi:hypothetical protein